jgi:hypothetical protein
MLNRFIKIAQKLDEMGMYGDSDRVTDVMQSLMPDGEEETEDIDTNGKGKGKKKVVTKKSDDDDDRLSDGDEYI